MKIKMPQGKLNWPIDAKIHDNNLACAYNAAAKILRRRTHAGTSFFAFYRSLLDYSKIKLLDDHKEVLLYLPDHNAFFQLRDKVAHDLVFDMAGFGYCNDVKLFRAYELHFKNKLGSLFGFPKAIRAWQAAKYIYWNGKPNMIVSEPPKEELNGVIKGTASSLETFTGVVKLFELIVNKIVNLIDNAAKNSLERLANKLVDLFDNATKNRREQAISAIKQGMQQGTFTEDFYKEISHNPEKLEKFIRELDEPYHNLPPTQ